MNNNNGYNNNNTNNNNGKGKETTHLPPPGEGSNSSNAPNNLDLPLPIPPPLKILVFGGSVIEGVNLNLWSQNALNLRMKSNINQKGAGASKGRKCTWPYRLEAFVNHIVQELVLPPSSHNNNNKPNHMHNRTTDNTTTIPFPPLIQVHNLAVGGTSTRSSLPVLNYCLSEVFAPDGTDVVLNDYSANDNYPAYDHSPKNTTGDYYHTWTTMKDSEKFLAPATLYAQSSTSTLFPPPGSSSSFCTDPHNDKRQGQKQPSDPDTTTTTNSTTRTAIKPPPSFPVTFFIDSYVGNAQPSILGKGTLQESNTLLAREFQHLGLVGYISAANMYSPFVRGNTDENVFSAVWESRRKWLREVHFPLSSHMVVTWAVAYGLLRTTLDFCEDDRHRASQKRMGGGPGGVIAGKLQTSLEQRLHKPSLQFPPPSL
jgi:hypothetical protein